MRRGGAGVQPVEDLREALCIVRSHMLLQAASPLTVHSQHVPAHATRSAWVCGVVKCVLVRVKVARSLLERLLAWEPSLDTPAQVLPRHTCTGPHGQNGQSTASAHILCVYLCCTVRSMRVKRRCQRALSAG